MNDASSVTLNEIFCAVFELQVGSDLTQLRQGVTEQWDSLTHVALVTGIESEFGITLDTGDQLEMTSYEAIRGLLERRGL